MDKKYSELSESTKKKLTQTAIRLDKANITPIQVRFMKDNEIIKKLNFISKYRKNSKRYTESLEGLKQNIESLTLTKERKQYISKRVYNKIIKEEIEKKKFRTKKAKRKAIKKIKLRSINSTGTNIFRYISKDLQDKYKFTKKQADKRTSKILKIPKSFWKKKLKKKERDILKQYGY